MDREQQLNQCLEAALADLQGKLDLMFLSDLHAPMYRPSVIRHLRTMQISKYPLPVWEKLLSYVAYENLDFKSMEEVTNYLEAKGKVYG